MTQRVELQSAYILHTRPYRDTSVIADVITPEFGRLALVGRGARGSRSRLRGVVQPFRRLVISWSGRGELRTLTRAEEDGAPLWLTGTGLIIGMYLNELLLRLMARDDPHPVIFECYDRTLRQLATQRLNTSDQALLRQTHERSLRVFEKELLRELGYGLILDHEVDSGDPIDPGTMYLFECARGPSLKYDVADRAEPAGTISIKGSSLLALDTGDLADVQSLQDAKRLLRAALAWHLSGRPLHSRMLLPGVRHARVTGVGTQIATNETQD